jgi:hypothetical protein
MKVRFLLDENLSPRLKVALPRLNPAIDVLRVGDPNAPPLGAPDAEVLNYLALAQRLLVTDNHKSMPGHLEAHWAAGGHIWGLPFGDGLFELRPRGRGGIGRALYCFLVGQRVVILHAFVKKSQKTSEPELKIARKRMKAVQNG